MDFELSSDQVDLQEGVRKLCEGRFSMETVRGLEESDGVDRGLWRELADAGVFNLRVSEAGGGVGLGMAEAALVFEELGRACVPGPLVGTELLGADDIVGIIERVDGPVVIEHLAVLDRLLVLDDNGVTEIDPKDVVAERSAHPVDPLTPVWIAETLPAGTPFAADPLLLRRHGALLTAAIQLGLSEAVLDLAVAYAKERQQFDRPIGSFQAVKHMLADMLVRTEVARAAVYAAAVTVDDPSVGHVARAIAAAKITAGEAAMKNGKAAIQVHGGMGFTWEVDCHLYLKRAWVLDTAFGSPDAHSEYLASLL